MTSVAHSPGADPRRTPRRAPWARHVRFVELERTTRVLRSGAGDACQPARSRWKRDATSVGGCAGRVRLDASAAIVRHRGRRRDRPKTARQGPPTTRHRSPVPVRPATLDVREPRGASEPPGASGRSRSRPAPPRRSVYRSSSVSLGAAGAQMICTSSSRTGRALATMSSSSGASAASELRNAASLRSTRSQWSRSNP